MVTDKEIKEHVDKTFSLHFRYLDGKPYKYYYNISKQFLESQSKPKTKWNQNIKDVNVDMIKIVTIV